MNTYKASDYIKIDIANQYGLDKKSFKQRIAWVNSVKDIRSKAANAEKPHQFMAAVYALEDFYNKKPSGHMVGLDACASGISILGLLTGCETTSYNTGLTSSKRMDMYSICAEEMGIDIERSDVKQSQMTHFYGSVATPKAVFGDGTEELMAFYQAQEIVAPGACMMMRELLQSWQSHALEHSFTLPDGFTAKIPVLQKMESKIEIDELDHATLTYVYDDNIGTERGLSIAANITHGIDGFIVRELVRRCNYNESRLTYIKELLTEDLKQSYNNTPSTPIERLYNKHGFMSLEAIKFINPGTLRWFSSPYKNELLSLINDILCFPSFEVVTIHDEFKCHPNYMNYLRHRYVEILAEIAESKIGTAVIGEVRDDKHYVLPKMSYDLGDIIREKGEYFLS